VAHFHEFREAPEWGFKRTMQFAATLPKCEAIGIQDDQYRTDTAAEFGIYIYMEPLGYSGTEFDVVFSRDERPPLQSLRRQQRGTLNARQLTSMLTNCDSIVDFRTLIKRHSGDMDYIHVGAAWSRLGHLSRQSSRGEDLEQEAAAVSLLGVTERCVEDLGGWTLASALWAVATLGVRPTEAQLRAIQEHAVEVADEFTPQGISNIIWAHAKMGEVPLPELLAALEKRAVAVAGEFKPQEVSNTLWAYATLGITPGAALLAALERRAVAVAGEFTPQAVSNTIWAYATLGITPGAALLAALEKRAVAVAGEFTSQAVVNLLWACQCLPVFLGLQSPATRLLSRTPWSRPWSRREGLWGEIIKADVRTWRQCTSTCSRASSKPGAS
jgi:hypothetical protein